jgi:hypothetical protein
MSMSRLDYAVMLATPQKVWQACCKSKLSKGYRQSCLPRLVRFLTDVPTASLCACAPLILLQKNSSHRSSSSLLTS